MISLARLDEIAHDPLQTHLSSFLGDRGPYPGHPADTTGEEPAPPASNPTLDGVEPAGEVVL